MELEGQSVVQVFTGTDILKHVEKNDFVISMRSFQGGLELCSYPGCVSSAYVGLIPIKNVRPEFFKYLFKCLPYIQALQSTSNLVRDGQALRFENFSQVHLPCIPDDEQKKLAAFLNHETAKIDALIERQQRLIELLKEKRLSLVHYATKEAPEVRLENCARLISRPISNCSDELLTPIGIYNRGRGIFHKDESLPCDLGDSDFFSIKENDLIFSGQFAWEGAVALADSNDDGCIASHRYPMLTGIDGLLSTSYLWAFFTSQRGDFLLGENSRGAAGRNRPLNMNSLMKEKIPLPNFEDQLAVSKVVYQERIISERVATVIATLQERRTALISAAVTGKIDVRDWQATA